MLPTSTPFTLEKSITAIARAHEDGTLSDHVTGLLLRMVITDAAARALTSEES